MDREVTLAAAEAVSSLAAMHTLGVVLNWLLWARIAKRSLTWPTLVISTCTLHGVSGRWPKAMDFLAKGRSAYDASD